MFCSNQCSFLSKRSTIDALAEITEKIGQMSTDTLTCILLDLRKTFDSTNLENLLAQLEKYGVRGNCLKLEPYTEEGSQCVKVTDVLSDFL